MPENVRVLENVKFPAHTAGAELRTRIDVVRCGVRWRRHVCVFGVRLFADDETARAHMHARDHHQSVGRNCGKIVCAMIALTHRAMRRYETWLVMALLLRSA